MEKNPPKKTVSSTNKNSENHYHVKVTKSVTVNKPAAELYEYWLNLENLPRFMKHLEDVKVQDEKHSHWKAKAPAGTSVEWNAEIINLEPNQLIAWRSVEGSDIENAGTVRFESAPIGGGTEITVTLSYVPPAGTIGKIFAKLFGEEPEQQVEADLRNFKALMEAGEIPTGARNFAELEERTK